jgi:hypothetical protein
MAKTNLSDLAGDPPCFPSCKLFESSANCPRPARQNGTINVQSVRQYDPFYRCCGRYCRLMMLNPTTLVSSLAVSCDDGSGPSISISRSWKTRVTAMSATSSIHLRPLPQRTPFCLLWHYDRCIHGLEDSASAAKHHTHLQLTATPQPAPLEFPLRSCHFIYYVPDLLLSLLEYLFEE